MSIRESTSNLTPPSISTMMPSERLVPSSSVHITAFRFLFIHLLGKTGTPLESPLAYSQLLLIPDWLGLRFSVRYIRNPVYPNTGLYKTYCELFLRGTEILGVRYVRIPV